MNSYLLDSFVLDPKGSGKYVNKPVRIPGKAFEELGVLVDGYEFIRSDTGIIYCRNTCFLHDSPYGWNYNHTRAMLPALKINYKSFEAACLGNINEHLKFLNTPKIVEYNSIKELIEAYTELEKKIYNQFGVGHLLIEV